MENHPPGGGNGFLGGDRTIMTWHTIYRRAVTGISLLRLDS